MAKGFEVLQMLCGETGWTIYGEEFENIVWGECEPITKKQFTDGFAAVDAWKAEQAEAKAAEKSALLAQLGITEDQAKLLLS